MARKLPDTDILIELNKTHTQAEIAAQYGVTRQAVSFRLHYRSTRGRTPLAGESVRRRLLDAIVEYKTANDGCAPSIRELMVQCDISTTSLTLYHMQRLERDGLIERDGHVIRVTGAHWLPPES